MARNGGGGGDNTFPVSPSPLSSTSPRGIREILSLSVVPCFDGPWAPAEPVGYRSHTVHLNYEQDFTPLRL